MESEQTLRSVEGHYGRGKLLDSIIGGLEAAGKNLDELTPDDLAPVDEFHIRGREATVQLAGRAGLQPGDDLLDVGCGIGGSARFLSSAYGIHVTGIDLTQEFVEVAAKLSEMVGMADRVKFDHGSATDLPYNDASFDAVWTEHVQMNIEDKAAFYSELCRVLRPGGKLIFHDIFKGSGPLHFPVPWANSSAISFLSAPVEVRKMVESLGMAFVDWEDTSEQSADWFAQAVARMQQSGPPPLGLHLLMGPTMRIKFGNTGRNLDEGRIMTVLAVAVKYS